MGKRFAVLGDPIVQSLSPKMHSAAYAHLNLDWKYEAFKVASGELLQFVENESGFAGFSVTMPLKFEAYNLAESLDETAETTGVVNTLLKTETGFRGFNTDIYGISKSIEKVPANSIAVLGSGATARSSIQAVISSKTEAKVTCYARNESAKTALQNLFSGSISVAALEDYSGQEDLTINTIPNVKPVAYKTLLSTSYGDASLGANEISGTEMLVWQALAQIRIFYLGSADNELNDEDQIIAIMRGSITNS